MPIKCRYTVEKRKHWAKHTNLSTYMYTINIYTPPSFAKHTFCSLAMCTNNSLECVHYSHSYGVQYTHSQCVQYTHSQCVHYTHSQCVHYTHSNVYIIVTRIVYNILTRNVYTILTRNVYTILT